MTKGYFGAVSAFFRNLVDHFAALGLDLFDRRFDIVHAQCNMLHAALSAVFLDETGDRAFSFARKPGADTSIRFEELDLSLIDEAKVFHFGTLSLTDEPARSATHRAVAYAKEKGKWITFDPNLRRPLWKSLDEAKVQMLWGLSMADIVKISDEETEFLFALSAQDGARHILDAYGVKLVFVTCGSKGCYFANRNACGHAPALNSLQIVDTTGAGDIFGGSALHKLLETEKEPDALGAQELAQAAAFACAAAGLSATQYGGISSVPSYDQVTSRLRG